MHESITEWWKKFVDPRLLYDILRGLKALWVISSLQIASISSNSYIGIYIAGTEQSHMFGLKMADKGALVVAKIWSICDIIWQQSQHAFVPERQFFLLHSYKKSHFPKNIYVLPPKLIWWTFCFMILPTSFLYVLN